MKRFFILLSLFCASESAFAADLQCKLLRLVVPISPGGATDVAARFIATRLESGLGRTTIVENRPGASGNIGTMFVINAAADGCTLLVHSNTLVTFPAMFSTLPYDTLRDLVPVGSLGDTATVVVASPALKANSIRELLALAKQASKPLNFSSAGYGFFQHLAIEDIAQRNAAKVEHITYKGAGPAMPDLVSGRVDFGSFAAATVLPFIKKNSLKALVVVQPKRSALLPDTPAMAEEGVSPVDASAKFMLFAPSKTPRQTIALLDQELQRIVRSADGRERLLALGFDPIPRSSEEAVSVLRSTSDYWVPVIKRLGIRMD